MLEIVDLEKLANIENDLVDEFRAAVPFKHIVFDGILKQDCAASLARNFPNADWDDWNDVDHEHQRYKRSCTDISKIPEPLDRAIMELNSGPFLNWLERITGIAELQPDKDLIGGGLHMTTPGGTLTPHTDFHVVKGNPHFRRLNLIIYLNSDWKHKDHGELELWDRGSDKIAKTVQPTLNTAVLFQTDDKSMHGFSVPIADSNRCSIAMYYYTVSDADEFSGDGATYWRTQSLKPEGTKDWVRLSAYRACLFVSRGASSISWRAQSLSNRLKR